MTPETRLNWDDARIFLALARAGSLSAAASRLDLGIATLSRRISRLETALQVPLFTRHQTGYRLTDQGNALVGRAEELEGAAAALCVDARREAEIVGRVRLATAENLANPIIIPTLGPLLGRHPGLSLEIVSDVTTVNLHRRDADLAVRMVRPTHGHLTVRRIGTLGFGLYGSPDYKAARAQPDAPVSPGQDSLIGWAEGYQHLPAARWLEGLLRGRLPVLATTSLAAQVRAATSGIGLAVLPHFLAEEAGLVRIEARMDIDQPIWLVTHADLSTSRRVNAVADHLANVFQEARDRLAGENC